MIVLACLEPPRPGRGARAAEILVRKLGGTVESIAVCLGGPDNCETLRWALSRGSFRRIIRLDDSSLEKADFMTVGMVLAELARHISAGVVIAGEHSDVEGQGLVPSAIAHHLRVPLIARVQELRLSASDSTRVEVTTRAGGKLVTVELTGPVVLSAESVTCEPAVPLTVVGASAVEALALEDLALDPSRLVPRPELLGAALQATDKPRNMTPEEAARFLRCQTRG